MGKKRPCNLGPVPETCSEAFYKMFKDYATLVGNINVFNLYGYDILQKSNGKILAESLLKLMPLLLLVVVVQPELRFKPVFIQATILKLVTNLENLDDLPVSVSVAGMAKEIYAKVTSAKMTILFAHFRRILRKKSELANALLQLSEKDQLEFKVKVKQAKRKVTIPPRKTLKRNISNASSMGTDGSFSVCSDMVRALEGFAASASDEDEVEENEKEVSEKEEGESKEEESESEKEESESEKSGLYSDDILEDSQDSDADKLAGFLAEVVNEPNEKKAKLASDRIKNQAIAMSKQVAPSKRGAQKHQIQKKPAAGASYHNTDGPLGNVKMLQCTEKSYILYWDHKTEKWPLVVEVTKKKRLDHQHVVQVLWEKLIKSKTMTKEDAVELRDKLVLDLPLEENESKQPVNNAPRDKGESGEDTDDMSDDTFAREFTPSWCHDR